jgi:hypothetical protein
MGRKDLALAPELKLFFVFCFPKSQISDSNKLEAETSLVLFRAILSGTSIIDGIVHLLEVSQAMKSTYIESDDSYSEQDGIL